MRIEGSTEERCYRIKKGTLHVDLFYGICNTLCFIHVIWVHLIKEVEFPKEKKTLTHKFIITYIVLFYYTKDYVGLLQKKIKIKGKECHIRSPCYVQ